ncbi:neurosecretory protein VGF [Dunckerocampus dactyliophorus]|uniref:neurosecretory protein VGF n=1 Tax=Dunckerocampus dactyliophorus TaxID=161453 RepID=UPI00240541C7|nr:neurosecretory protein VGF [Dunckerocampus dactyliophorus]
MMASHSISSALILLVLLTRVFDADLSMQSVTPAGVAVSGDTEDRDEGRMEKRAPKGDDLFDDVDPKTLAALLLEALNRTRVESRREEESGAQRDRDGRQKLELLMAAQGQEEAEEKKKAEEEEERMTERVSSRTSSQTLQVQTQQPPAVVGPEQGGGEEEQLNPEELRSLETMMKEFPRLDTAIKRGGDSEPNQRESRGYSSFNDIIPLSKGSFSEKKLKWQEETQKALNMPAFRGGNFMDDFEGNNAATVAQPLQSQQMESDDPEEEEDEVLTPEEEEAQAKAEQEEMRRQAAEAQKAKMEEEKLADIASDMLLRYMVKQNGGSSRKYPATQSDAAADKRSEEEQEDDDIDPQTIDKLIEISNKLHLPADDVVDIISDVEKKKKKDVAPDFITHWQRPQLSSADSFTKSNSFQVSKQPSPAVHILKSWFQEPSSSKGFWSNPADRLPWSKPLKSINQEAWLQTPRPVWTHYPSFYQRKPHQDYYPIYFPPPRPTFRYYVPKPALAFNTLLQRSQDGAYSFLPKQRYLNWMPPRLRKPPAAIYPRRPFSFYPHTAPKPGIPLYQSAPRGHLDKYIEQLLLNRPQD